MAVVVFAAADPEATPMPGHAGWQAFTVAVIAVITLPRGAGSASALPAVLLCSARRRHLQQWTWESA